MTPSRQHRSLAIVTVVILSAGIGLLARGPLAHASGPPGTGAWSASVWESGWDILVPGFVYWEATGSLVGTINLDGAAYALGSTSFSLSASSPAESWVSGSGTVSWVSFSGTATDLGGLANWSVSGSGSGTVGTYERVGSHVSITVRLPVDLCPASGPCSTVTHEFGIEAEAAGWSLLCYCSLAGAYVQRELPGPIVPTTLPTTTAPTTTSTLVPPTTVPPLVKSVGMAAAQGDLTYGGAGVPAAPGACVPTTFSIGGSAETVVVNTAATHYRGPLSFVGSGSSACEAFTEGTGALSMAFDGEAPTGATIECPPTAGTYERRGLAWRSSVTTTCSLNGLPTPVTVRLEGILQPDPPGAGLTAPLVAAEIVGTATVVPA